VVWAKLGPPMHSRTKIIIIRSRIRLFPFESLPENHEDANTTAAVRLV
jgi:hypothetical protein